MIDEGGVSRETQDKLAAYVALVRKWNPRINLVSRSTLAELETRHIADSRQLFQFFPHSACLHVDLGSGGGLPGIVLAALAGDRSRTVLIESDQRKASFLRQAGRELGLNVDVIAKRIENVPNQQADIITARALAPLTKLLELAVSHETSGTLYCFPKGAQYAEEIEQAKRDGWRFDLEIVPSETHPDARILLIRNPDRD